MALSFAIKITSITVIVTFRRPGLLLQRWAYAMDIKKAKEDDTGQTSAHEEIHGN